jgi:flagellar biogenesis protein FliO
VAQAGVTKIANEKPKSSFSIATYVGKFIAFLSLMILGFYGVLTLFKKGVIKKGRLGFLHSTKLVEVLSTTHIAPKRTLIMVKAHKQVFLVSNTEAGIQLISEIQDVTGLIKNGELEISGSNFETNLVDAGKKEKEFKLKEVKETSEDSDFSFEELMTETPAAKSIAKTPVKDDVRLSDQIKTKIKNLKQLQ